VHSIDDLTSCNQAYTRLSEKFKTLFTFHQFLQGLHKTLLATDPPYSIDFQKIYEEIKGIAVAMTFQPPSAVLDTIQRFDVQLDGMHRTLADDDATIPPSSLRRFLEKVKTDEEKLLVSLLRFYFLLRSFSHDVVDKVDVLVTIVGARRSLDDGHYIVRFPVELQKLFSGLIALAPRTAAPPELVSGLVESFGRLRRDIEACQRFDQLAETKVLDNLRRLKHNMGSAFYTVEALSAMLEANLAAKNKFAALYEAEERRILEASRQLARMEKELEGGSRWRGEDLEKEFRRFHELKKELEQRTKERGVRRQEVRRLTQTIDTLLARLDLPGDGGATRPPSDPSAPSVDTRTQTRMATSAPLRHIARPHARADATPPEKDPLTQDVASRVLSSVEVSDGPNGTGARGMSRFRLEPWEISAARRILKTPGSGGPEHSRDVLFFESALVRIRIDEEAQQLRSSDGGGSLPSLLAESALCLSRAQDLDRRFRAEIEGMGKEPEAERVKEVNRSRFRLLRSFSGLWLLHDTKSDSRASGEGRASG
jgi:hypothetical protein